jgi:serralysin
MCSFCSLAAFQSGNFSADGIAGTAAAAQSFPPLSNGAVNYVYETTDAADNTSTAYSIAVGDFFIGSASSTTNTYNDDWIRFQGAANTTYTISMNSLGLFGAALNDPYIILSDSAGNQITFNNDGGPGNYAQVTFTTTAAGTYYIGAGAAGFNDSGQYAVTITAGSKGSFDHLMGAAALYEPEASWSPNAAGTAVNVTFAMRASGPAFDASQNPTAFLALTAAQTTAAQMATQMYSEISGLSFTQVSPGGRSNNATVLFGGYSSTTDGAGAYAYFPGDTAASSIAGDVWLNNDAVSQTSLRFGSYDFYTILHELGHAVGLAHPGDYNAAPGVAITYAANAQFAQDSLQYTVMSYFAETNTGANFNGTYADTLMLYDVFALHQLYGADFSTRAGNTVYGFNSLAGDVYNFAVNVDPALCIWDGGGNDTLDVSGWSMAQTINLAAGSFSSVGGLTYNVSIAFGATIENAVGGSGADTIIGNFADNVLYGNGGGDFLYGGLGNDIFIGGTGADVLNGDAGFDAASYALATAAVQVRLDGLAGATGEAVGDTFSSIEGLIGSDFNDVLTGANLVGNYIDGQNGSDTINGLGGDDYLVGGEGFDSITGGTGSDSLYGGAGDDYLWADLGSDYAYGGSGNDTIRSGFVDGIAAFGEAGNDVISAFTGVDYLDGGDGDDIIFSGANSDALLGGAGNDALAGSLGNDTYTGGAGFDYFNLSTDISVGQYDVITDWSLTEDFLYLSAASSSSTYFGSYAGGAFSITYIGSQYYVVYANGATAADLQASTFYV